MKMDDLRVLVEERELPDGHASLGVTLKGERRPTIFLSGPADEMHRLMRVALAAAGADWVHADGSPKAGEA